MQKTQHRAAPFKWSDELVPPDPTKRGAMPDQPMLHKIIPQSKPMLHKIIPQSKHTVIEYRQGQQKDPIQIDQCA
jgi:hypothetical protein